MLYISLPVFFAGGYISGGDIVRHFHARITSLCGALSPDAVSLADVIAPPDFVLDSALGHSSGEVRVIKYFQK